jgi:hypothetical protein
MLPLAANQMSVAHKKGDPSLRSARNVEVQSEEILGGTQAA